MAACVDLREQFGDRFQITMEESYHAQYGENARTGDFWYMTIRCQHGEIIPWGDDYLAACTDRRGAIAKKLGQLPCTTVVQDGSDGTSVLFHVRDFEPVAELMKPRRRRRLSPEQRRAAIERLRSHQFTACHDDSEARKRAQRGSRDTLDVPTPQRRNCSKNREVC
jgi:hypothetical protein